MMSPLGSSTLRRLARWGLAVAVTALAVGAEAQGRVTSPNATRPAQLGDPSETSPARVEPDPLVELVPGEESAELRELRLLELELFAPAQPLVEVSMPGLSTSPSDAQAANPTSSAGRTSTPATSDGGIDRAWLEGLTLPDIPVRWDERIIRFLEFFRSDPRGNRFIRAWVQRMHRYGPTIRAVLERMQLPRDLLFVAMVESGFDPGARSGVGAVGMWQFMEPTGESFGLQVGHWVDLRLDPERSTEAAGRYLAQLHARFGTWELALAAYNMGYGALLRSIRKYNSNDYWALSRIEAGLPFETTLYVAKIVACAIVAHNPERFGLNDLVLEEPLRWETVEVPGGLTLGHLARTGGTTPELLRQLNPSLRRGRTPPGVRTWTLRVPPEAAPRFAERHAERTPSPPAHARVLRFGETVADIARETGMTEHELRELNGATDSERISVGTTLLVAPSRRRSDAAPAQRPVIAVPDGPTELPERRRVFYRVIRGDQVEEIARFFRVRVDDLRRWNVIDPDAALQTGMFLQLFVPAGVDLEQAVVLTPEQCRVMVVGSDEFFDQQEAQNGRVRFRYRVERGDTLSQLSQRFGLSVASIMRINRIPRDSLLREGETLVIYADPAHAPRDTTTEDGVDADAHVAPQGPAADTSTVVPPTDQADARESSTSDPDPDGHERPRTEEGDAGASSRADDQESAPQLDDDRGERGDETRSSDR